MAVSHAVPVLCQDLRLGQCACFGGNCISVAGAGASLFLAKCTPMHFVVEGESQQQPTQTHAMQSALAGTCLCTGSWIGGRVLVLVVLAAIKNC